MPEVWTVSSSETVEQLQSRMVRARESIVYIECPSRNANLRSRLALTRLRRTADDLALEIRFVTRDRLLRDVARAAGFEVLPQGVGLADLADRISEPEQGEVSVKHGQAGEVESLVDTQRPAVESTFREAKPISVGDTQVLEVDRTWVNVPVLRQLGQSYIPVLRISFASLGLAIVLLCLGLVLALFVLPKATIVVVPGRTPIETTVQIWADPDMTAVDVVGLRMPARRLSVTLERQAREMTTARIDVPDGYAESVVVFINQSESEVIIPPESLVHTGDGTVSFRTVEEVILPGPAGATRQVQIRALSPGPASHVPGYSITQLDPGLGLPVAVRNEQPTSGGTVRPVGVVTQDERDRVRTELYDRVLTEALESLSDQIRPDEILVSETIDVRVVGESVTEQAETTADVIVVDLVMHVSAVSIDQSQAKKWVEKALSRQVGTGQEIIEGSLEPRLGSVLSFDGSSIQFQAHATAQLRQRFRERDIKNMVRGRLVVEAVEDVSQSLSLAVPPAITVSGGLPGRIPWLTARIAVVQAELAR